MSARVTVAMQEPTSRGPTAGAADGRPAPGEAAVVAVKIATSAEQIAALAVEAARLQQASHPGVVTFVEHRVFDHRAELHTRFAGEPLGCWRGTPGAAAGVVAAVAATVADLHEVGVVHGRIDLSHVLVDADGRPRLCGWSPAEEATAPDDVAALGRLLQALVGRAEPPRGVRPSWFLWPRARAADQRALAQLVAHATEPLPSRRPTARAFARAILSAVPGAELAPLGAVPDDDRVAQPPPPEPTPAPTPASGHHASPDEPGPLAFGTGHPASPRADDLPEPLGPLGAFGRLIDPAVSLDTPVDDVFGDQTTADLQEVFVDREWGKHLAVPPPAGSTPQRPRPRTLALTAAALGLAAAGAGLVAHGAASPGEPGAQGPVAAPPTSSSRAQPCAPTPPPAAPTTRADVDGDGCPDDVVVHEGVVEVAGQRWAVGAPGDLVTVGDWDCDGRATPAVYRPTSGDVFVFSEWADVDEPVTVEAATQVPGGRSVGRAAPRADGAANAPAACDLLSVELESGPHIVEVAR